MLKSHQKKSIVPVSKGKIHVVATFNNTMITITDDRGNVLDWSTAGKVGFKGTKKSTPYAAAQAMKKALEQVAPYHLQEVQVLVSGVGAGRDAAVRTIGQSGLMVSQIRDITPIPHNGPRPKKPRRV